MGGFTAVPGALGQDVTYYDPSENLAVPNPDTVSSAFQLSGMPTFMGTSGMVADGSGIASVAPSSSPANPNQNGGWENVLTSIINSANKAMSTYVSGSPSVAIPPARQPGNVASGNVRATGLPGGIDWKTVGIAVGVGVVALVALGYFA